MSKRQRDQVVTIDGKGRVVIPKKVRNQLGIGTGDSIFVRVDDDEPVILMAPAINPFDGLAMHAIKEHKEGRTKKLEDFAEERGIDLEEE